MDVPKFCRIDDDANLIFSISAVGPRAAGVFAHRFNASRYVPSTWEGVKEPHEAGQDLPTESLMDVDEEDVEEDEEAALRFTFDNMPKDIRLGFGVGCDPKLSDVFCGYQGKHYFVAALTSLFTFDERGRLFYQHVTKQCSSTVQYNHQPVKSRRQFKWYLMEECDRLLITIAKKFQFLVKLPHHGENRAEYQRNLASFLQERRDASRSFETSTLSAPSTSASLVQILSSSRDKPYYFRCPGRELGRGTYGRVFVVKDVSTGRKLAAKTFEKTLPFAEAEILKSLCHVRPSIASKFLVLTIYGRKISYGTLASPPRSNPCW